MTGMAATGTAGTATATTDPAPTGGRGAARGEATVPVKGAARPAAGQAEGAGPAAAGQAAAGQATAGQPDGVPAGGRTTVG